MNFRRKPVLIIAAFLLVAVIEVIVTIGYINFRKTGTWSFFPQRNKTASNANVNPHILVLTKPVHSVLGTVINTNGDTFTVRPSPRGSGGTAAAPDGSGTEFSVRITGTTRISINRQPVPHLFPQKFINEATAAARASAASAADIEPGRYVTVSSTSDLRTAGTAFDATDIAIQSVSGIQGTVTAVHGNVLDVTGVYLSMPPAVADMHQITAVITPDTELSYEIPPDPDHPDQPIAYRFPESSLKPGMGVIVYSTTDIAIHPSFAAARIYPTDQNRPPASAAIKQ